MKMTLRSYDLQLKHTFKIAHDERDIQQNVAVAHEVFDHRGLRARGHTVALYESCLQVRGRHLEPPIHPLARRETVPRM